MATKNRPTVAGLQRQFTELKNLLLDTRRDFCGGYEDSGYDESDDHEPYAVPPPPAPPDPKTLLPQPPESLGVYAVKDGKFTFRRMVMPHDLQGFERADKAEREVERLRAQVEQLKAEKEQLRGVVQYLEKNREY